MSSQAQIEANRLNALKSTGPRTSEGKARSSQNARRDGIASFQRMLDGYLLTYKPVEADEVDLLTDAVLCKWRQQTLWNIEAQTLEAAIAARRSRVPKELPKASASAQLANAFKDTSDALEPLRRSEAVLHGQYLRKLKMLRELQASRTRL